MLMDYHSYAVENPTCSSYAPLVLLSELLLFPATACPGGNRLGTPIIIQRAMPPAVGKEPRGTLSDTLPQSNQSPVYTGTPPTAGGIHKQILDGDRVLCHASGNKQCAALKERCTRYQVVRMSHWCGA